MKKNDYMETDRMVSVISRFCDAKTLVIGDLMLDKYTFGDVKRLSPEAPVPLVEITEVDFSPGGASNVAANIASLGGHCALIGVVGDDEAKKILINKLKEFRIDTSMILTDRKRPTTIKERVISKGQHLLRIDFEEKEEIGKKHTEEILNSIKGKNYDLVIVSDYAKGVVNPELMEGIKKITKKVIIDPKPKNKALYKGAFVITPNRSEAMEMQPAHNKGRVCLSSLGRSLSDELDANLLLTKGDEGMLLFQKGAQDEYAIPTRAREVYDITGAGDTVVAALALSIASGADLKTASIISNYAAGVVVGKLGTATLAREELIEAIKNDTTRD